MVIHHYHGMEGREPGLTGSHDRQDVVTFFVMKWRLGASKPPCEEDRGPRSLLVRHYSALGKPRHTAQYRIPYDHRHRKDADHILSPPAVPAANPLQPAPRGALTARP